MFMLIKNSWRQSDALKLARKLQFAARKLDHVLFLMQVLHARFLGAISDLHDSILIALPCAKKITT